MSRFFFAVSLTLLLTACSSTPSPAPAPTVVERPAPRTIEPGAPAPQDPRPASPDALVDRTSAYAAALEQWLAERHAAKSQPASAPSAFDPKSYTLTISPRAAKEPTRSPEAPVANSRENDAAPAGANQIASLVPAPKLDTARAAVAEAPARAAPAAVASDELERKLREQIKNCPKDVVAQLDLQLLLLLRDEQVPQLATVASLGAEDREMLSAIVDGLSNLRSAVKADANMLSSRKIRPMIEMADRLRAQADLRIPTVALCTKVDGFGTYEPIEPLRFAAGKANPAILYCEVENFASQLNDRQLWETRLTETAELWTETGMLVWQEKSKPVIDVSRNRRHDFFLVKKITLPSTLTINRYVLKVSVVDQQANRVAEATMGVQVVAQ